RPLPEAPSQPLPPEPSPTHPYPSVTQSRSIASPPGGAPFAAPLTYQGAAPLVSPAFPGDAGGDRLPLRVSETTHPPEKFGTGGPEPGPTLPAELPLPPEPRARPGPPAPVAEPPEPELVRAMRAYLGKRPDEAVE